MLRQPSQSSSTSEPIGVTSGLIHHNRRDHALLVVHTGDEQPNVLVHLRPGQTDALAVMHGLEHVVDKLLDARRADLIEIEAART